MENIRVPVSLSDDKNITFKLEQDFDQLEILSLKVSAFDVYAQMTSEFGVVVGRVNVNGGFGVQNAKVSIFVPITADDELRNEITQLYPFKTPVDKLTNNVRYNIFPRIKQQNYSHQPIGIFPDVSDLTYYPTYLELYEKYYKFTTTTNDSGDYMIFGVPLGAQYVHMDFDLFDTKSFYVTADDLVMQIKTSATITEQLGSELTQAINPNFTLTPDGIYEVKVKADLDSMPNIYSEDKIVNVVPFWGDKTIHEIGITRCDFDISYEYVPTAIFFGSFISMNFWGNIRPDCSVEKSGSDGTGFPINLHRGAEDLKIVAYKHLGDYNVERYGLYSGLAGTGGSNNGVFVMGLPMYEDYYVTDEFGQLVPSTTKRGIPTKGHYVFEFFDDAESRDGNGRREPDGTDGINYWANLTAGIRVPADRKGHPQLGGWKSSKWSDETLFEYDILKGSPRFYTVKSTFRKHKAGNVFYDGNVIEYLPKVDISQDYNIPFDGNDPPEDPTLVGCLYSPRFNVQDAVDQQGSLLYANQVTWIPSYPKNETARYQTQTWDWIYGIGVKHLEGVNRGEIFSELYPTGYTYNLANFRETQTWFFGDNPWDGTNPPIINTYATLLAEKPEATNRNINGVHTRFNLAVTTNFTAGLFISSVDHKQSVNQILCETYIQDVTDILPDLVSSNVYTSYGFEDNKFAGNYYLFGILPYWQNALYAIKKRYFNE